MASNAHHHTAWTGQINIGIGIKHPMQSSALDPVEYEHQILPSAIQPITLICFFFSLKDPLFP